jgi:hypothetical protein
MCVKTLLENTRSKWASGNGNGGYRPFRSKRAYGKFADAHSSASASMSVPHSSVCAASPSSHITIRPHPHPKSRMRANESSGRSHDASAASISTALMRPDSRNVASPSRTPDTRYCNSSGGRGFLVSAGSMFDVISVSGPLCPAVREGGIRYPSLGRPPLGSFAMLLPRVRT